LPRTVRRRILDAVTIDSHNAEETRRAGRDLGARLKPGDVVALVGELGAGKTVFTRGLVEGAGAEPFVASPTFVLQRLYPGPVPVRHFDLYRLEPPVDLEALGFFDGADRAISVVEWADRAPLDASVRVSFEIAGAYDRRITVVNS
jgi:tRNA threonylcarbamoyladenosine biosynthesis protein TsaE